MTAIDSIFVTRNLFHSERFIQNQAVPLIKLMELLGPGGALERLHYEKLPRKAQYEVIKEVLWTAYQDTWRLDWTTLSHEKKLRKRPTMKYAMKNLLEHLGLNKSPRPPRKSRKRARRVPPLGAGFGGLKRRDIEKQPLRSNVEIFLPSIAEEEPAHKSSFKQLQKHSLFFRPSDMELKAKLGRPEFSPSIEYRAGNMYNFENRSYERMKKKLRRQYYKNMTAEEKQKYKEERATRRAMRAANGEVLSSESDLSGDDSMSDVDPQEYQNFILEKQRRRAHKNMLKAAGQDPGYDSDEFEDDYWSEKKGNIPLDMQRRLGFAQILAPGPELLDISLPKDEEAKQKVLEMFKEVLKDELQDMVDGFELDSDEEDEDALGDEEIEKMLASGVDVGDMLSMQDLSPETRKSG
ncbi:Oidioi.mRNA.OKI2018_I69.PAR.g10527.t1.cds [Oikopleura dioica]|uniref:Oidioi.mRNA.OKI2018_I69.PAR.g10527.t1.cds n=1 Tax=Oikopleura dioica TaxID=34765 RepID=A0ABN7RV40_OIKDI|nr:Oidioi.mRNA.OKI2018_I69.PAR.g10527.t1.cds [Oikopleura dioica]